MDINKKIIALNLTNISNIDSEVNLLSSIGNPFDTYYNVDFLDIFPDVTFQLDYTLNGSPISYLINGGSTIVDIDSLIVDLNTNLGVYALFSYSISSTPNYYNLIIKILDSSFVPSQLIEDATSCPNCIAHDVVIGTQTWTGCNANVSTYANGDVIPQVTDPTAWAALTTGAWCYYNNDPLNEPIYGKLYNWYAVNDPRGLAPTGYHVSTDAEWTTLSTFLGGNSIAGGAMKEGGLCHWQAPNIGATNSSGFTALPGGTWSSSFIRIGLEGYWWTSDDYDTISAPSFYLNYSVSLLLTNNFPKFQGKSVRFIKN